MYRLSSKVISPSTVALCVALAMACESSFANTGGTVRISVDSAGAQGNGRSGATLDRLLISADGRFVVFDSDATNLVADDTNARSDVFVRDRLTNETIRMSVDASGAQSNGTSVEPVISIDDRWVVFRSSASNLVAGDANGVDDVFAKDRQTGAVVRVSVSTAGVEASDSSFAPAVSSGGRYVVYESFASNLVAGDTNNTRDIFLTDRDADADGIYDEPGAIATVRLSISTANVQGDDESRKPSIVPNGRYVAYESDATNLVPGDTNSATDIFVRDRIAGTTTRVSLTAGGLQANGASVDPVISGTGRYVVFASDATNLVSGDTNGARDIFVRDRDTDADGIFDEAGASTTIRVSVDSAGAQAGAASDDASITGDGRYVVFRSIATNLVANDTNGRSDVFIRDLQTGTTTRVSIDSSSFEVNGNSYDPSTSTDGRLIAFASVATNLVGDDTNAVSDVFMVDRLDSTPPTMECPSAQTVECASSAGSVVTFTVTASDSCDPSPIVSCVPASGSTFALGTVTVHCTATDAAGNVGMCAFDVMVADTTAPALTCPGSVDVPCAGPSGAIATFNVTAADACDPTPTVACVPASGSLFAVGHTTVVCGAQDDSTNASTCSFGVNVLDVTAPTLTCPSSVAVECADPTGAAATYKVTVTDDCDIAPSLDCTPPSGSAFPIGRTPVGCTARDASGNVATCAFDVVIADTTAPAIECPGTISTVGMPGSGAIVDFTVTATDACDPNPRVNCMPPSGSLFPVGATTVACTAIDSANNLSGCSFEVRVGRVAVTSILPNRGAETGADVVTLNGFGFTDLADTMVTFGGAAAQVTDVTPERIRAQTPPGTGAVDVTVTNSNGSVTVVGGFTYVDPGIAVRYGNVNVGRGDREDVLTINGSIGDASRELNVPVRTAIEADMATPSSRTVANFALYAWLGAPNASTLKVQPFGIGTTIFPTPLTRVCTPQPRRIWNNAGHLPRLGVPNFPSTPAPSTIFRRNHGFNNPITASLQGVIRDSGSQNGGGFSITNAIVLHVTP
ncbi:MAG: HYR domain-containing protein [Planctomycetes bacterium]|nr:HYR domain-containing protein [Planctomycetota bacterium]